MLLKMTQMVSNHQELVQLCQNQVPSGISLKKWSTSTSIVKVSLMSRDLKAYFATASIAFIDMVVQ